VCGPVLALAETVYVTDILLLGLHEAEDTTDQPFRTLVSGTELEVLVRVPNYARVQTADGQQGWVKSGYLVADKPAQLRVAEVEATLGAMREELTRAQAAQQATELRADQLKRQFQVREDSSEAALDTLERLKSENESYEARMDAYRGSLPIAWVAAALVVTLVGGFLAGMWWLDFLSRRRHDGFRVY
jgi:SH3 domain protein